MVKTVKLSIFVCPFCNAQKLKKIKKLKLFKTLRNLNIHISITHNSKYKVVIVGNSTPPKLRLKHH